MRKIRRISLVLAVAVLILALTGCGGMTTEKLALKMVDAAGGKIMTQATTTMDLELDMTMGQGGMNMELGMDVKVVGVGTPNEFKPYVKSGTISTMKLWDPKDSGWVMCKVAAMILGGEEIAEGTDLGIDGYHSITIVPGDNQCIIGQADITITAENIDNYNF